MTSFSRRITSLTRYGVSANHISKIQAFSTFKTGIHNNGRGGVGTLNHTISNYRMMSSEATLRSVPPRKRRGRFKRRLLFWGALLGAWLYFVDADFITYFSDMYRILYKHDENIFQYKTLWIVGASSGIGEYLVYEAAKNNAKKIIISARRVIELERVKTACNARYPDCEVWLILFFSSVLSFFVVFLIILARIQVLTLLF